MSDKKGNIVFFNSTKVWGGGEKWHFDTAKTFTESGWKVTVFCHRDGELKNRLAKANIPFVAVKITNFTFLQPWKIISLARKLKSTGANTIIMNLSADLKAAGLAARRACFKNIIYRRGSAIPVKNTFFNRYLFSKVVTNVLANSFATRQTVLQNNPALIDPEKIKVIYNGLKLNEYENVPEMDIRSESDELIIGSIGRMVEQKNQKDLIVLAAKLKEMKIACKVLIVGDGNMREELEQRRMELNVEEEVEFLGYQQDVRAFLQTIDIFVLTSKWEGFGYVLAEAMCYKKPVLGYDLSSNPELIEHGKNGLLIPAFNTIRLAREVMKLSKDQLRINQMGKSGFEMVHARFDFQKNVKEVEEWIASLG
jgi:glycosyltransferase involved in cell wall biosynthesis